LGKIKIRTNDQITVYISALIIISILLNRYLKTKRTSLFTSAATNQRGVFQEGGQEKLRSDFQRARRRQSSC